jgi:hypothetical protein
VNDERFWEKVLPSMKTKRQISEALLNASIKLATSEQREEFIVNLRSFIKQGRITFIIIILSSSSSSSSSSSFSSLALFYFSYRS